MKSIAKRKWRAKSHETAVKEERGDERYQGTGLCSSFYGEVCANLDNNVLVVLTSGGRFSAITGVVASVYADHLDIVTGNIITSIPLDRIAALSRVAGGGPLPPLWV